MTSRINRLLDMFPRATSLQGKALIIRSIGRQYFVPEFYQALPLLRQAVDNPAYTLDTRIRAAEALVLAGAPPDGLMAFLASIVNSAAERSARLAAINALGYIGPQAAATVPLLLAVGRDAEADIQTAVLQALRLIQPPADMAPELLSGLARLHPDVETRVAIRLLADMGRAVVLPLVDVLSSQHGHLRYLAAKALDAIGWAPPEAADRLLDALTDDRLWNSWRDRSRLFTADRRLACFFWFDEPLIVIKQALTHADQVVRRLALSGLTFWPEMMTHDLLPDLCATADEDGDSDIRQPALRVAASFAHQHPSAWAVVWPVCQRAANDPSRVVRRSVLDLLYWLRPPDQMVLRRQLATDPDDDIRHQATATLSWIESDPAAKIAGLLAQLGTGDTLNRDVLVRLRRLRQNAVAAIPELLRRFDAESADPENRAALAYTVAILVPQAAIRHQMLHDADGEVRRLTLAGICEAEDQPADLVNLLTAHLSDPEPRLRFEAATYLWKPGAQGIAAAQAILGDLPGQALYACKERVIYFGAPLASLCQHWPEPVQLILEIAAAEPLLINTVSAAWCQHPDDLNLCRLYWTLTAQADDLMPHLIDRLRRWYFLETVAVLDLLYTMGPQAKAAMPMLRQLLKDPYWLYRWYAVQVLGRIGPAAADALGDVVQMLDRGLTPDDDTGPFEQIRVAAATALGNIVPGLQQSVAVFQRLADNDYVRRAVARSVFDASITAIQALLHALASRHGCVSA